MREWDKHGNAMETTKERCPDGYGKDLSILSNEEEMAKVLLAWKKAENRKEIILPLVQNLEGAVLELML